MIKIPLTFTIEEAVKLLQEVGLTVKKQEVRNETDISLKFPVSIWMVQNPHNGSYEEVEPIFRTFILNRKNKLFLAPDKFEIYELFNVEKEQ